MEEKLAKVRDLVSVSSRELAQVTTDDPALFAAVDGLIRATAWLLDAVEQMHDDQRRASMRAAREAGR